MSHWALFLLPLWSGPCPISQGPPSPHKVSSSPSWSQVHSVYLLTYWTCVKLPSDCPLTDPLRPRAVRHLSVQPSKQSCTKPYLWTKHPWPSYRATNLPWEQMHAKMRLSLQQEQCLVNCRLPAFPESGRGHPEGKLWTNDYIQSSLLGNLCHSHLTFVEIMGSTTYRILGVLNERTLSG